MTYLNILTTDVTKNTKLTQPTTTAIANMVSMDSIGRRMFGSVYIWGAVLSYTYKAGGRNIKCTQSSLNVIGTE